MRRFMLLPLAAALSLPAGSAFARDRGTEKAAAEMTEIATTLQDPAVQADMTSAVTGLVDAMMDMPIGPLARLAARIDPDSDLADVDEDATVADLAGRKGRRNVARLDGDIREGTAMMGEMTAVMATMLPAMAEMVRDMEARWKERRHHRD